MTIILKDKGLTVNGQWYAPGSVIVGLDPDKEAAMIAGGNATPGTGPVEGGGSGGTITGAPAIIEPVVVGIPATFTPAAGVPTSTQWAQGDVDVANANRPTFTVALADYAKTLAVKQYGTAPAGRQTAVSRAVLAGFMNIKLSNTVNLRAMRVGGVRGQVYDAGDSLLASYGATGAAYTGQRTMAPLAQLATLLTAAGLPARADWSIGSGVANTSAYAQTPATWTDQDPRVTFSGGSVPAGFEVWGGRFYRLSSAGNKLIFTPGNTFDIGMILFAKNTSGQGNFTASIDGGTTTAATIADNDAVDVALTEIAVAAGSTALTLVRGAALSHIIGVGTRTSTAPGIEILNGAMSSCRVLTLATPRSTSGVANIDSYNTRGCLAKALVPGIPKLGIANGHYNDRTFGRSSAQVAADLTTLLTEMKTYGDVVYVNYPALSTATISPALFNEYSTACINAALALDVIVCDISKVQTDWTAGNARGDYYDDLHLNAQGLAYVANMLKALFFVPIY